MKKLHLAAFLAMATAASMAQSTPKAQAKTQAPAQAKAAAPAPAIPADVRARFFKAKAQQLQAQLMLLDAQNSLQQTTELMKNFCSKQNWTLAYDQKSNEPVCAPNQ